MAQVARVEVVPKLDGRNMTMVLAPDKKAKAARDAQRKAETDNDKQVAPATAPSVDETKPEDAA